MKISKLIRKIVIVAILAVIIVPTNLELVDAERRGFSFPLYRDREESEEVIGQLTCSNKDDVRIFYMNMDDVRNYYTNLEWGHYNPNPSVIEIVNPINNETECYIRMEEWQTHYEYTHASVYQDNADAPAVHFSIFKSKVADGWVLPLLTIYGENGTSIPSNTPIGYRIGNFTRTVQPEEFEQVGDGQRYAASLDLDQSIQLMTDLDDSVLSWVNPPDVTFLIGFNGRYGRISLSKKQVVAWITAIEIISDIAYFEWLK